MKLSVLMPALESRPWAKMANHVRQMASDFPGDVEFIMDLDNGKATSGVKRQRLTDRAQGEYVCFVDDDDSLSDDYVGELMRGCYEGVDVVSFDLSLTSTRRRGVVEKWSFGMQANDRKHGKMCVNHLCAWRTSIARLVRWCPVLGYADDRVWFEPLFHSGSVKTHYHVDKVLYRYLFNDALTQNQTTKRVQATKDYIKDGLRCFFDRQTREILIEAGWQRRDTGRVVVRGPHPTDTPMRNLDELEQFHVITMA